MRYGHLNNLISSGGSGSGQGGSSSYEELPVPITSISIKTNGYNKLSVKWDNVPSSNGYKIAYAKDNLPTVAALKKGIDVDTNNYTISGLTKGSKYGVWVATKDENGNLQTAKFSSTSIYGYTLGDIEGKLIEIPYPSEISGGNLSVVRSTNGALLCSSMLSENTGIWLFNSEDGVWVKIFDTGYYYNLNMSDKNGNVYLSSDSASTPTLMFDSSTNTIKTISSDRYTKMCLYGDFAFFAEYQKSIKVVNINDRTIQSFSFTSLTYVEGMAPTTNHMFIAYFESYTYRIIEWNGTEFVRLDADYDFNWYHERPNGELLFSDNTVKGVYKFIEDTKAFTLIPNSDVHENYTSYADTTEGTFIFNNSSSYNVLLYDGSTCKKLSLCASLGSIREDSNNNIYFVPYYSHSVYLFNKSTKEFEEIGTVSGYSGSLIGSDNDGNVFLCDTSSSYKGIYRINGSTITNIYGGCYRCTMYEDENSITFVPTSSDDHCAIYNKASKTCTASSTYGGIRLFTKETDLYINNTNKKVYVANNVDSYDITGGAYINSYCTSRGGYVCAYDSSDCKVLINIK